MRRQQRSFDELNIRDPIEISFQSPQKPRSKPQRLTRSTGWHRLRILRDRPLRRAAGVPSRHYSCRCAAGTHNDAGDRASCSVKETDKTKVSNQTAQPVLRVPLRFCSWYTHDCRRSERRQALKEKAWGRQPLQDVWPMVPKVDRMGEILGRQRRISQQNSSTLDDMVLSQNPFGTDATA